MANTTNIGTIISYTPTSSRSDIYTNYFEKNKRSDLVPADQLLLTDIFESIKKFSTPSDFRSFQCAYISEDYLQNAVDNLKKGFPDIVRFAEEKLIQKGIKNLSSSQIFFETYNTLLEMVDDMATTTVFHEVENSIAATLKNERISNKGYIVPFKIFYDNVNQNICLNNASRMIRALVGLNCQSIRSKDRISIIRLDLFKYLKTSNNEDIYTYENRTTLNEETENQIISFIPFKVFKNLNSVSSINFEKSCFIQYLGDGIGSCTALRIIDVSNNKIQMISDKILNCKSLEKINLSFNKFKTIPQVIYDLNRNNPVCIIDLSSNNLSFGTKIYIKAWQFLGWYKNINI